MYRKIARNAFIIFAVLLISNFSALAAPDGKALFQSNCASCHNPIKDATGPALKNVDKTFPSKDWVYGWVHNSSAVIASGDKFANDLYNKWNKTQMTAFPQLSKEDIDAILSYVNSYEPPAAATPVAGGETAQPESNGWLYTIITLALLLLVLILWRANRTLRRAANEKEGVANEKEIPLYRNKTIIAVVAIVLFIAAGYWMVNGAINMGRQQNYQPRQPIFYSHAVHVGINEVNCLYCHAGAEKSRQAMIPSPNICMNCHKQINEYTGEKEHPLYTAEGQHIDGTAEIHKLYEYAGWDPEKKDYKRDANGDIMAKPIAWTKIHNLPDHVYFNHSQHVKVGQIQCQRCHGPIQEMDEVYQFAPLSMGWCVNCHRQTQVQFASNDYYSIFQKYHEEIKEGKRTGVTVEDIGGLECQRCHY
ncbi:MAG: cytochrome C [Bacteroidetes bacterium 46-16]|nr:MAG: cytochrome C [Bacteroidetes bacterium 46-16]